MKWMALIFTLFCLAACTKKKSQIMEQPPVPVIVDNVHSRDVPIYKETFGTMKPYYSINLVGQVSGQLIEQRYKQGAFVRRGDLLAVIDPRIYQANLDIAKANLQRDQATLTYAEKTLEAYRLLLPEDFVSQIAYAQYVQNVELSKAAVASDIASIKLAEVNLGYTQITAPVDGVIGISQLDPGNYVVGGSSNIATLLQITPIYAIYYLPESYLYILRSHQEIDGPLQVLATFLDAEQKTIEGKLDIIDNSVSATTGTIVLQAVFPNDDHSAWAGQFVRVKTRLNTLKNVAVIPSIALQNGQTGPFVYIVKEDLTVEVRNVTVGEYLNGEVAITNGLSDMETVVVDGQLNLSPGAQVTPQQAFPHSYKI